MEGLCEGGNEPPGSLKASKNLDRREEVRHKITSFIQEGPRLICFQRRNATGAATVRGVRLPVKCNKFGGRAGSMHGLRIDFRCGLVLSGGGEFDSPIVY
ncbi:hypothetical protein ANN_07967 [Periplaneta americana]|uniref:Uncharacterized protein n=1 Tax=Periplaneta americana TaxID=6978 RepID=A0ABQ8T038_PERAM|nr:hypothetical protein ANN_07967 [Periplaneta americana]